MHETYNCVLLVEDNADDVALARRAFRNHPDIDEVIVVSDGPEALEFLFREGRYEGRDMTQQPVVTLLDIKLPKMSGLDVLMHIRGDERTRFQPVVLMSSSKRESDMVAGYNLGANSYMQKPVSFEEFAQMMKLLGSYWGALNKAPSRTDLENYN